MDHATKVASLATLQAALIKYYEMVAQVKATATAIDAAIYEVHANAASCRVELARLEAEARAVEGADHAEIDRRAAELFSQIDAAEARKVATLEAEAVVADKALEQAVPLGEAAQAAADAAAVELAAAAADASGPKGLTDAAASAVSGVKAEFSCGHPPDAS